VFFAIVLIILVAIYYIDSKIRKNLKKCYGYMKAIAKGSMTG